MCPVPRRQITTCLFLLLQVLGITWRLCQFPVGLYHAFFLIIRDLHILVLLFSVFLGLVFLFQFVSSPAR